MENFKVFDQSDLAILKQLVQQMWNESEGAKSYGDNSYFEQSNHQVTPYYQACNYPEVGVNYVDLTDNDLFLMNQVVQHMRDSQNYEPAVTYEEPVKEEVPFYYPTTTKEKMYFIMAWSLINRRNYFRISWSNQGDIPRFPQRRNRVYKISGLAKDNGFDALYRQSSEEIGSEHEDEDYARSNKRAKIEM